MNRLLFLCTFFAALLGTPAVAQGIMEPADSVDGAGHRVELMAGMDIVSQYVWRGMNMGSASFQPTLGIGWRGLSLSAWGSVGFARWDDAKEIDLTLSYTHGGFTVGLTDYWCDDPEPRYFAYKNGHTSHVFEGMVCYDFGFLRASWQTIFAGNDGVNGSGARAYSSYFELAAPFRWLTCDWEAAVGIVPYATDYYEAEGFRCTNVSLHVAREIPVTRRFSIPLFVQLTANPNTRHLFLVAGVTLAIKN